MALCLLMRVALHQYQLLTPLEQEALQFWIAYAVAPTKQA